MTISAAATRRAMLALPSLLTATVSRAQSAWLFPDTRYWNSGTWWDYGGRGGIFGG